MWRQLIWLGLGLSLLGVAAGRSVSIELPPEGYPVSLYKLSFSRDGSMFVVTASGVYKRLPNSKKWDLFFRKNKDNEYIEITHEENGDVITKEKPSGNTTYRISNTGKILERLELPQTPIIFNKGRIFYCKDINENTNSDPKKIIFPPPEEMGICIGGLFHQDNAYIFTERFLLKNNGKTIKTIDRFRFSNFHSNDSGWRYPDLRKFDLIGNLYSTAERPNEGGREKHPIRFVVKIRPDGTLSKILNFGFKDFTPKSIELVGVVDNDVFINVNGKDLYVSRDGGKTASRISKIKNERNNINCASFYEIIKGPDNLLYALDRDALYKSRDRGETWEIMDRKGIPSHYKD